jgi:DNA-binding transcriptional regulator YiaG
MKRSSERRQINGEWVKALRKGLGLNQDELAEQLGVSRSAVARWELDAFRPSKLAARVLLDFAEAHRDRQGASKDESNSTLTGLRARKP